MVEIKNDGMMWALVKEKPEEGLWMKRVPIPEVGPNDVKIKIHKTAICGTDVHIYQWNDWAQHTIPIGSPLEAPKSVQLLSLFQSSMITHCLDCQPASV